MFNWFRNLFKEKPLEVKQETNVETSKVETLQLVSDVEVRETVLKPEIDEPVAAKPARKTTNKPKPVANFSSKSKGRPRKKQNERK